MNVRRLTIGPVLGSALFLCACVTGMGGVRPQGPCAELSVTNQSYYDATVYLQDSRRRLGVAPAYATTVFEICGINERNIYRVRGQARAYEFVLEGDHTYIEPGHRLRLIIASPVSLSRLIGDNAR